MEEFDSIRLNEMTTTHKVLFQSASKLAQIKDKSVSLVVTSPPYPMIEMWDDIFSLHNPEIRKALNEYDGKLAFNLMHEELDKVWTELYRVLIDGGIACINIGDATRSINGNFQLFCSHSRILNNCSVIGFQILPVIVWRKQTNAPNKFMGSGMLPPGAYITLEHEFVLILRKGNKREFKSDLEKANRQKSAYFWEERNLWFSDIWTDLKGIKQSLNEKELRKRSGAYPFELPYRLINMFSVKGDLVLDPFLGTGTTTIAAIGSERNSIGIEIDEQFSSLISERILESTSFLNNNIKERIQRHNDFITKRKNSNEIPKHESESNGFSVITRQEKSISIQFLESIKKISDSEFIATYTDKPVLNNNYQIDLRTYY